MFQRCEGGFHSEGDGKNGTEKTLTTEHLRKGSLTVRRRRKYEAEEMEGFSQKGGIRRKRISSYAHPKRKVAEEADSMNPTRVLRRMMGNESLCLIQLMFHATLRGGARRLSNLKFDILALVVFKRRSKMRLRGLRHRPPK